jgi:hypothetical protein
MRTIKSYTVPLILACIGFLFGIFWSNFSSLIRPIFSSLSNNLVQLETYSQSHPIESGVSFAVIGALIAPVATQIRKLRTLLFHRPTIIDLVFKSEDHVHAVVYHMTQESFTRIGGQQLRLPTNAVLLPYGDAISRELLSSYCHKRYSGRRTAIFHDHDDRWEMKDHNFICVGGPFTNKIAKRVLESIKIPDFTIDNIPTGLDSGDRYEAERENASTTADAPLVKDYGFIIFMKSPWNRDKKICLLFGLWTRIRRITHKSVGPEARFRYHFQ